MPFNELAIKVLNQIKKTYLYFEKTIFKRSVFLLINAALIYFVFDTGFNYIFDVELKRDFQYQVELRNREQEIRNQKFVSDLLELCQYSIDMESNKSDEYCTVARVEYVRQMNVGRSKMYDEDKDLLLTNQSYALLKVYSDSYIRFLVDLKNNTPKPTLFFEPFTHLLTTKLGINVYLFMYFVFSIWPIPLYLYRQKRGLIKKVPKYYY
ncbi:hypothetical protein SKP08_001873 [Vibrio fluvialis]|nr:hypothetical protein [Vibrio fluvialis]